MEMLNKLALRNAKRSFRDYLIYLMTMIFTAALMFSFDSMIFSDDINKLCSEAGMMGAMLGLATFFIVLIIIWLVHYMMKFMAEKRSREFATYLLLGFHKKQIARLFLKEMLLLGLAAFIIGLLPGLFLQQLITTLIYAIVQAEYTIHIQWNMGTFFMTAGIFFGSYILAMFRSSRRFKKMNIREMMYLDRQNEELKNGNRSGKQWMFFVSLFIILLFGWLLYFGHFNEWNVYPMIAALMASVYFLYMGLSAFLISYIRKGKAGVYTGANIFLLRQLASKVKTMQFTLGTLTILFMVALVGVSDALMLNQFQNTQAQEKYPFDVCIYSEQTNHEFKDEKELIEKYAQITNSLIYNIYQDNTGTCWQYLVEQLPETDSSYYFQYDTYIRLSDYNSLRQMLGLKPVSLTGNQYLIQTKKRLKKTWIPFTEKPLKIQNADYTCAGIYTEPFEQSGHNGADYLLVVPDDLTVFMTPYYSLMAAEIKGSLPDTLYDQVLAQRGIETNNDSYEEIDNYIDNLDRGTGSDAIYISDKLVFLKDNDTKEMKFLLSTLIFPLFYVGLVFLCVALTVLAVQQLSDSGKYKYRYQLLGKLGMRAKELNQVIFRQLVIYYICPFAGAVLLSGGIVGFISHNFVKYSGIQAPSWSYFGLALLLFGGVYLIYFIATYIEFKRNIMSAQKTPEVE